MTKWYKRSKIDKGKGREDNSQEPVSSKSGSPMDLAAKKNYRGSSSKDPSRDAAASSNEFPNQPPPENHQIQAAGAKGLDPAQQQDRPQQMAEGKFKEIHKQHHMFLEHCFKHYNGLMKKMSLERRQIYQSRLNKIKATFPGLFDDNRSQTTSTTKYHLSIKLRLGKDQRGQAEIGVRQFYELTRELLIRDMLHADAYKLIQHIYESHTLWMQTQSCFDLRPENYSPFYSMKDVKNERSINIASTLPNASGIRAITRVLSHFHKYPTEQEVAKLAGHSEHKGTSMHNMQEAFKPFGIDYSYTRQILTIHDIEKVTKCGSPIITRVYKEGIGGSFVVIEKVNWENGEPICTIYDPYYPNNQKIREIPYRKLQLALSDHHLLPTNWQNLSESTPETAVIQQQQDINKKAAEHQAIIAESKNLLAKHSTILQESKQALSKYQQQQSDPQYTEKQEAAKTANARLLEKLREAQRGTTYLDRDETENQTPSITDLEKIKEDLAQHESQYQRIVQESKEFLSTYQSDPQKYAQEPEDLEAKGADLLQQLQEVKTKIDKLPNKEEQKIIIDDTLWQAYVSKPENEGEDYTKQEEIRSSYKHIKNQLWRLCTPEDKAIIQKQKLDRLYGDTINLHKEIARVLNEDTAFTIRMQLQQVLTPEDEIYIPQEKIEASCRKLEEIYQKMTATSQTMPDELPESAHTTKTEIKPLREQIQKIQQAFEESEELLTTFNDFLKPPKYNPYYSMDGVKDLETVNIDSTRRNQCGILTTRRALFLLGIDIQKDATEKIVTELANHSEEKGSTFWEERKAFAHFGIEVSCIHEALTIDDIERITGCGHPITIEIKKEGFPIAHALLIEKVSRNENGDPICTVFDLYDLKIKEIPYGNLEKVSNDRYLVPTNYRELTQCVPGSDEMKLRFMRHLENKVAACRKQYLDISEQSKQALSVLSDSQKYAQEQEAIKTQSDDLLKQLHEIERRIHDLPTEEQDIILDDKLWRKYVSKDKDKDKDKDYTEQELIRSSYKDIKAKLWNSRTSENEVYIQRKKLLLLDKSMQGILQESNSILSNITIDKQENTNLSTTTHQELTESAYTIKTDLEQLCKSIQESTDNLRSKFVEELMNKFEQHISKNYSPYFSSIEDKESINIDSTLPRGSGISAIRRILSLLLDKDTYKKATEKKVAELANYFKANTTFAQKMPKAFKYFNIDYSYTRTILTIGDIQKLTERGHPVLTRVYKEGEGIKGHFVTIEKVSWTQNGEPICTIYDPSDPNNQKIRRIPYRELQLVLSDHHLLPTKWRELVDTHEAQSES